MEDARLWKIPSASGWIKLRVVEPGSPEPRLDARAQERARAARFQLLYELRAGSASALSAVTAVWSLLRGPALFSIADFGSNAREEQAFERLLEVELAARSIELDLEPFWTDALRERDSDRPATLPELLSRPEEETHFIAANLLDQRGQPVVGRRFWIELPDGSKRTGYTDLDGWARVTDFTKDGAAKIAFEEFDELDHRTKTSAERLVIPIRGDEPAEEERAASEDANDGEDERSPEAPSILDVLEGGPHFIELRFVDDGGEVMADVPYIVTLESGEVFQGAADSEGFARIVGIASVVAKLELDRDAADWQVG